MWVCAKNESKGTVLAARTKVAFSFWHRLRGLLGTRSLPAGNGMWLKPCRCIHTYFMTYAIDALFLDEEGLVLAQCTLVPWRASCWKVNTESVLELPAGTLERTRTEIGDRVSLKPN